LRGSVSKIAGYDFLSIKTLIRAQPAKPSRRDSIDSANNAMGVAEFRCLSRQQPREGTPNISETEKTNSVLFHSTPFPLL
jgi:hypothetical protein